MHFLIVLSRLARRSRSSLIPAFLRSSGIAGCFAFATLLLQPSLAATQNPWYDLGELPQSRPAAERWVVPESYRAVGLNVPLLLDQLADAKPEASIAVDASTAELLLPLPAGGFGRFRIVESPVMAPELAAKFPEVKTYLGQGVDDPTATVRLDWTPAGFHAQVLSEQGAVYVDPAFRDDPTQYVCYDRRNLGRGDFSCLVPGSDAPIQALESGPTVSRVSGASLRTYRLACAATAEYTAYHGGTVAQGQAAIVTAVNRITGIYEREVAIRLVLVANNNLIVYTSAAGDPYTNNDGFTLLDENQSNLDSVIGSANYDIGHVFSTGGGGVASLGSVCAGSRKAQGVTGSAQPTGDAFWVDYVAHEMGHQFGANHSFNSTTSGCGGGNRNASTAYEPGSASTIMGYAGLCGADNLQSNSNPFFHAISFDEIVAFSSLSSGNGCAVATASGNSPPTVSAGPAYVIPSSTPFTLTASGSDANGDALTYCWEQMNLGAATTLTAADNGASPLFRSFSPSTNRARTFPKWTDILNNLSTPGEKLPTTSRTMNFRVTARDNRAGGGGVNTADTTVTSVATAGPFVVTSPNTAGARSGFIEVTWNVAGTASAPINTTGVNILLSTNGGSTFSLLLATNTPNDGSEIILLPNLATGSARIMVAGAGNIFFDVSNANFGIIPAAPVVNVILDSGTLTTESCGGGNGAVDPGETVTMSFALRNSGTLATTNLIVTLLDTNGVVLASAPQTYGTLVGGAPAVSRSFSFTAEGACSGAITARLQLQDGAASLGTLTLPITLGSASSATRSFTNGTNISINSVGSASPYPSGISVSGVVGTPSQVTVTLRGLTHTYPDDVDVLLVGPTGQTVVLMSDVGGGNAASGVNLTFSSTAGSSLPDNSALTSGTWRPTNIGSGDSFNSPAPAAPHGTTLAGFNNLNPNGTWSLFIMDDAGGDSGSVAQGWVLDLTVTNPPCCLSTANLALGGAATPAAVNQGDLLTFTLGITNLGPGAALEVTLTNSVPAGLTVLAAEASQGTVNTAGNLVTGTLGPLAAGGVATLTVQAQAQVAGSWTNSAIITSTTSDPASGNNALSLPVFVNAAPALSPLADLSVAEGQPIAPVAFTVGDAETPAGSLSVSGTSANPALVPNTGLLLNGSGSQRTLTILPVAGVTGDAVLTVEVTDGLASASRSFTLTVLPRPVLAAPVLEEAGLRLTWTAVPGRSYRVQYKDDLGTPTWSLLGTDLTAVENTLTVLDPAPAPQQRFYQILLLE